MSLGFKTMKKGRRRTQKRDRGNLGLLKEDLEVTLRLNLKMRDK